MNTNPPSFVSSSCYGFAWQGFGSGGAMGFCEKLQETSPMSDKANAEMALKWTHHWPRASQSATVVAPL